MAEWLYLGVDQRNAFSKLGPGKRSISDVAGQSASFRGS